MSSTAYSLVLVPPLDLIRQRLSHIFPDGFPKRHDLIADRAAKSIQVMFYAGALEGAGVWVRPSQITRMTDSQMARQVSEDRLQWSKETLAAKAPVPANPWYGENTRESVRDDTLRYGLVEVGAVVVREGVKPTSSKPRYALSEAFAKLFQPELSESDALSEISVWRDKYLSKAAMVKAAIKKRHSAAGSDAEVAVRLPNGQRRLLSPGESSEICRAVIESFALTFLAQPVVLLLSESGRKLVWQDESVCSDIGLKINVSGNLPDVVLADLNPPIGDILIVFVEAVHSDGPISEPRKRELGKIAFDAGFEKSQVAFVTAFTDRKSKAFAKVRESLAWDSFAWFASEPEHLLHFIRETVPPTLLASISFPRRST
jgi:hypothetical protein